MKTTIEKDGVTQEVKTRYLHNFLSRGWQEVNQRKEKVSKIGVANATADVKKEDVYASEPLDNEGEK